jgi:hypothetical protein
MQLNVKNKRLKFIGAVLFLLLVLNACRENKTPEQLTIDEKRAADSLVKIRQKRQGDSLKKTNPLLIIPPDSSFTGDYVDRYGGSGIIKFKGFFRFGQRHGQWVAFYPSGQKWSEMEFDNGLKQGLNIAYYPDGKKRFEGFYKKDIQDSVWIYYDSVENVLETHIYKLGQVIEKRPGTAANAKPEKKK